MRCELIVVGLIIFHRAVFAVQIVEARKPSGGRRFSTRRVATLLEVGSGRFEFFFGFFVTCFLCTFLPADCSITRHTHKHTYSKPKMAFVDLSGDGGVQKQILQEGSGDETPSSGCTVSLHYTGTLDSDGKQFDSSRDRNEPFEFKLGQGSVIKAFDMGVATMKLGEKCVLKCAPDYAYGASGSPPNIPPNSTLNFELEMLGWKGEDLSPGSDKSIERFVLTPGEGKKTPNDGALVKIHLVGRHEGRIFEERDVEFNLGEGEEDGIVSGVEIALEKFKKGETAKLIVKPKFAYGVDGNKELGVPANATLEYTITMNEFEREPDSWKLDDAERMTQAKLFKEKGTNYFKANKFSLALKMYEKSRNYVTSSDSDEFKQFQLLIYLNKALCYQKLNNHDEARDAVRKNL